MNNTSILTPAEQVRKIIPQFDIYTEEMESLNRQINWAAVHGQRRLSWLVGDDLNNNPEILDQIVNELGDKDYTFYFDPSESAWATISW